MWKQLPSFIKPDVWLDDNHCVEFKTRQGDTEPSRALWCHRTADGEWCIGGFQWRGPGVNWTLVSMEPLHVEPSILCVTHGDHGFIRDGKWMGV